MLFQMSNQDENKSKHWVDRFAPFGVPGFAIGILLGVLFEDASRLKGAWSVISFSVFPIAGAAIGIGIGSFGRNLISWFKGGFKTRLSKKILGIIFTVVFALAFFQKADTETNHPKILEGILSGGWHGAVAVLMVLAGVVLWKLATKDAPKPD